MSDARPLPSLPAKRFLSRQEAAEYVGVSASTPASSSEGEPTGSTSVFAAGPVGERLSLRVNAELAHSAPVADRRNPVLSEIEGNHAKNGGLAARFALTPEQTVEAGWSGGRNDQFFCLAR